MTERESTAEMVYDWAVEHDLPAPDAFAMRYWDLAGATMRLNLAATLWRQQVRLRRTGFPVIDEEGPK